MNETYTDITFILDRSGSMSSIKAPTIESYNKFLADQKKETGQVKVTLVQFDHIYEIVYQGINLVNAPFLCDNTYLPRGNTALLDAIGKTIDQTGHRLSIMPESERPHQVLIAIMTDGYENASEEYTYSAVVNKVHEQENKYSWQFVFLGANQDAIATAAKLGMTGGVGINYTSSASGVHQAINNLSECVKLYRGSKVGKMTDFAAGVV